MTAFALGGCVLHNLKGRAARDLGCPEDQVQLISDSTTAEARGCGRTVAYEQVCGTSFTSTPSKFVTSPGSQQQQCGYEGWGKNRGYRCRSVWVPGKTTYERGSTSAETTCMWVARARAVPVEDVAPERGWERQYRGGPASPSGQDKARTSTATPEPSGGAGPDESLEQAPARLAITDLGDLAGAEAVVRTWVGKPVRVALASGQGHEGVLQYVRTYTLWFVDGASFRLEDILGAELVELAP